MDSRCQSAATFSFLKAGAIAEPLRDVEFDSFCPGTDLGLREFCEAAILPIDPSVLRRVQERLHILIHQRRFLLLYPMAAIRNILNL